MTILNVVGQAKYVEFATPAHVLVNGTVLNINSQFRVNDNELSGAPGGDYGDYYIFLRPNRKVMESYYSKNWEYVIKSLAAAAVPSAAFLAGNPDELLIAKVMKRQDGSGNTVLTATDYNRTKRLIDSKDISDEAIKNSHISTTAAIAESKLSLASDAAIGTPSRRTLGTGALQAAAGDHIHDSRYSGGNILRLTGGWGNNAPPNATSGTAMNIAYAGNYLITFSGSAYKSDAQGMGYIRLYINGTWVGNDLALYYNVLNTHLSLPASAIVYSLNAGNNYFWYYQVSCTSDNNDAGSVTAMRLT